MARSVPDWLGIDEASRRRRVSLDLEQLEPRVLLNGGSPQVERVSLAWDGSEGLAGSGCPAISEDGRYVAFESDAPNLAVGDANYVADIFVVDRDTGGIERVSVSSAGQEANDYSSMAAVSADGRYVAFESWASNLVPSDANDACDVFVYDRLTSSIERVSVASGGGDANADSYWPSISADGRYVAFDSDASNLVPGDTNGVADVFVYDRQAGTTERVSLTSGGAQGGGDSYRAAISADGRYVAFESHGSNLVAGDTNEASDVFRYDRDTDTIERVSVSSAEAQGSLDSYWASVSADGRYVAFCSDADNLVPGDSNGWTDIFVRDCQAGTTARASVAYDEGEANGDSFAPTISADGRYVSFASVAGDLVADDTNGMEDVFVYDRTVATTVLVSRAWDGGPSNEDSAGACISADGQHVAFESWASNLVSDDANGVDDVFVADLGGGGGVTDALVWRGDYRNSPATGDEDLEYHVEVWGLDLTRLELTTPWDEAFDSAGYVGPVWDGTSYEYDGADLYFAARVEGGECHFDVSWEDLSAGQWASLDTGDSDLTVTYTGGSWVGTVDFSQVAVPSEVPQITYPVHLEIDVPLRPTVEWESWTAPGPDPLVVVWLQDDTSRVEEHLAADATSWAVPEALDSDTQYDCAIGFLNCKTVDVSAVGVVVVSCTESDVGFTTVRAGLAGVCIQREYHYNLPVPGDEALGYRVEVEGNELTRVQLTTPWGEGFDSADYVGPVWDGAGYDYEVSGFEFDAYVEGGERHLEVA